MAREFGFDSHCHLDYLARKGMALEGVMERAESQGIKKLVTIATSMKDIEAVSAIVRQFGNVYMSVGLHPCFVADEGVVSPEQLLLEVQNRTKVVALGETGLDYYRARVSAAPQKSSFIAHIEVARDTGLPVVIHSRAANEDMLSLLEREKKKGDFTAIWHCFEGSMREAKRAIDLGLMLSFSGLITQANKAEMHKIAKELAWEKILVETDSPYLLPQPLSKSPLKFLNEPAHIIHTEAVLAEIREVDLWTLRRYLSENFDNTFGLTGKTA